MKTYFWDIETSKVTADDGSKIQVTFLSNVLEYDVINDEEKTNRFFRTIDETIEYFKTLEECIVFVHNLNYEFSFLVRDIENPNPCVRTTKSGEDKTNIYGRLVYDFINREKNSNLSYRFECLPNIEFRCSYALLNKPVEQLGRDLGLHKLEYDYSKVRMPWDKLEKIDYEYNTRDNLIVAKSVSEFMNMYGYTDVEDLPLTFTSNVKKQREIYIARNFGNHINRILTRLSAKQYIFRDMDFFTLATTTYQGGLTTSNKLYTGHLMENMLSVDIKSSYPTQMITRKFPVFDERTNKYKGAEANEAFRRCSANTSFIGIFKISGIKVKNEEYLLPISSSQIGKVSRQFKNMNVKLYNGKLVSAKYVYLPCTNIDLLTILKVYSVTNIECLELYTTTTHKYLPYQERDYLLRLFDNKENLPKDNIEYAISKTGLNGMYGIKVTSPTRPYFYLEDLSVKEMNFHSLNKEEQKDIYERFRKTEIMKGIDCYTDGIFITCFARDMLVDMMIKMVDKGYKVVYADTDSLKFITDDVNKTIEWINKENNRWIENNKVTDSFVRYNELHKLTEKEYNKILRLGIWEIENINKDGSLSPYTYFKTYGAKKYGYIDKKPMGKSWSVKIRKNPERAKKNYHYLAYTVHTTIAGCNKKNIPMLIENYKKLRNVSLVQAFDFVFALGSKFDESCSGRTVAHREERRKEDMEQLTYQGRRINQYGGTIIEDTTYTLGITKNDFEYLVTKEIPVQATFNIKGEVY